MKKIMLLAAAMLAAACSSENKVEKMNQIDNRLTTEEMAAGIMTPEVMWKIARVGNPVVSPDGKSALYTVTSYSMPENKGFTAIYAVDLDSRRSRQLTDFSADDSAPAWYGNDRIYFLSTRGSGDNQLWSMDANGRNQIQVSNIEGGIEGFGIAPEGGRIFYVKRVPVVEIASAQIFPDMPLSKARIYDDLMVRHWNYWDMGSYMHIFVAGFDGKSIGEGLDITSGEPWDSPMAPYFDTGGISWSNDGGRLAYTCKKLRGREYALSTDSGIYIYDAATKRTEIITRDMPGYDMNPRWSPDDTKIAFESMRRAGNESDKSRLFVADLATGRMSCLTEEFDYSASNLIWSGDAGAVYFVTERLGTRHICRADMAGNVELVTRGVYDVVNFDLAGNSAVVAMQSLSKPTELYSLNLAGGGLEPLTDTNPEFSDNIRMGRVEERWVRTTDDKQMLTWIVFPPDFDPSKKYPTLLYCQGGPQSVVSQFWSYRWNLQLIAAQGYVVVAPNRRGLPSFGQEWLDQISGDYSGQNIRDYLSAIDDVAAESWSDENRLGCVGASYGGYSVFYLAGNHGNRFKAFIAHCGIFNFESMYGSTEELWFVNNDYGGAYWEAENAVAQRSYENSPHRFVRNWNAPMLIVTGESDYRIPYTQSLEAFTAARMMGIESRLISFEDEAHQVFKPQNSIIWNREFFGWLDRHLKE